MLLDLSFFGFQNLLTPFTFCADLFVFGFDLFAVFACFNVLILQLTIAGHNLFHIVDRGQELIKVPGTHKNIQNVITAALLHRPDAGAVFFELHFFSVDRRIQFFSLLGNNAVVHGDFFGNQGQGFLGNGILFFESRLLVQNICLFVFQGLHICFGFLHLG